MYKILLKNNTVVLTHDKILADFMNKRLTLWQRVKLFFTKPLPIHTTKGD
jgi:hypothetical protein